MNHSVGFRKYLELLGMFFRASLMADLEYRLNFVLKVFTDICWYLAQILVFEILFTHMTQIRGWDLPNTRVFMGFLWMIDALWMTLFSYNMDHLSDKVRKGDLDFLLTKPVDSQFMVSFQRIQSPYIVNFFGVVIWFLYSLNQVSQDVSWWRLLSLIILIPASLLTLYSMRFLVASLAVIFTKAESVQYIWYQIYRMGARPDSIYPVWLRYILHSFLPVAFIASVPSQIVLGSHQLVMMFLASVMSIGLFWFSRWLWNYSLGHYTSASS